MRMLSTILDLGPRAQHGRVQRQRAPVSAGRDLATLISDGNEDRILQAGCAQNVPRRSAKERKQGARGASHPRDFSAHRDAGSQRVMVGGWLITQRSLVQIQPPQPVESEVRRGVSRGHRLTPFVCLCMNCVRTRRGSVIDRAPPSLPPRAGPRSLRPAGVRRRPSCAASPPAGPPRSRCCSDRRRCACGDR